MANHNHGNGTTRMVARSFRYAHAEHGHDAHGKPRSFEVRVLRQDGPGQASYWERHTVPYEPEMNVIRLLQRIAAKPPLPMVRKSPLCLGLQLFGRSLRRLYYGDQWSSASIMFRTGR